MSPHCRVPVCSHSNYSNHPRTSLCTQMTEDGGVGLEFPGLEDTSEYERLYDLLLGPPDSLRPPDLLRPRDAAADAPVAAEEDAGFLGPQDAGPAAAAAAEEDANEHLMGWQIRPKLSDVIRTQLLWVLLACRIAARYP